jgi:hypothetical protein
MKDHKDFETRGFVSVWIGDNLNASSLDEYLNLSEDFEKDFGFCLNERAMPETVTKEKPTAIAALIDGFSWADRYKDAVLEMANRKGIEKATALVVLLNFRYVPSGLVVGKHPLRFLCAVPF